MAYLQFFLVFNVFLQTAICLPMSESVKNSTLSPETVELCKRIVSAKSFVNIIIVICHSGVDSEGNQLCRLYNWISGIFGIAKETGTIYLHFIVVT